MAEHAEDLPHESEDGFASLGSVEEEAPSENAPVLDDEAAYEPAEGPVPVEAPADTTSMMSQPRPVPRISIDCFCQNPDTGATVQRAAEDRRLSRTHTTVYMGGVDAAIDHYDSRATPNLIVVETRNQNGNILSNLAKLAERCDANTKVIVIGAVNDIALYRDLMREGVSDYLIAPMSPLQFIESVSSLYVDPEAAPIGKVIVFAGTKGGSGSSTIAHNVGWLIAEEIQDDVTIVDFDIAFGTAGLDFNQEPAQGVADALVAPERLDDVLLERLLVKCTDHLNVLTAPAMLDKDTELDPSAFEAVLDVVRQSCPVVIVDLPHVWSAWAKQVLVAADEVVLVTTPDLAGLRNTKNLADLLVLARPNDTPPSIVLNQCGLPKRPEIPAKDFAEAIGRSVSAAVPFDATLFGTASNNGQMVCELKADAKPTEEMRDLAQSLTGRKVQPKQKTGVLAKLMGKTD